MQLDQVEDVQIAVWLEVGKSDAHTGGIVALNDPLGAEIHGAGATDQMNFNVAESVEGEVLFRLYKHALKADVAGIDPGLQGVLSAMTEDGGADKIDTLRSPALRGAHLTPLGKRLLHGQLLGA
jgi:hypothetical protein